MDASFNQPLLTKAKSDHKKRNTQSKICAGFTTRLALTCPRTWQSGKQVSVQQNMENPIRKTQHVGFPSLNTPTQTGYRASDMTPSEPLLPHLCFLVSLMWLVSVFCFVSPVFLGNFQRETVKLTPPARSETGPRSLPTRTTPAPQSGSGP